MHTYRNRLPQLSGDVFLTDGGLETTLIFHDGLVSCLVYDEGKSRWW